MSDASDFADGMAEFNRDKAEFMAAAFGRTPGEADTTVPNIQCGSVTFRAAFAYVKDELAYRTHGVSELRLAVLYLPTSLGIEVDSSTRFTHLPTGDVFMLLPEQVPFLPHEAHRKIRLQRLEE